MLASGTGPVRKEPFFRNCTVTTCPAALQLTPSQLQYLAPGLSDQSLHSALSWYHFQFVKACIIASKPAWSAE